MKRNTALRLNGLDRGPGGHQHNPVQSRCRLNAPMNLISKVLATTALVATCVGSTTAAAADITSIHCSGTQSTDTTCGLITIVGQLVEGDSAKFAKFVDSQGIRRANVYLDS